jgi:hypothetical protein
LLFLLGVPGAGGGAGAQHKRRDKGGKNAHEHHP